MLKTIGYTLSLLIAPGGAAMAQTTADSKAPMAQHSGDKLICHTDDSIGSRLNRHKTCLTAAQWRESSQNASDWLERRTQQIEKPGGN